ncbi:MAG: ATP-grasp domain-containing protein [Planctomycetaceae bacterium]|nr:ATP-grasp domain-containing protein [Planctomycetaceae bacterium]
MIILDSSYVSPEIVAYAAATNTPVLDNDAARAASGSYEVNLLSETDFAARLNQGARLYTTSENSLGWVLAHATDPDLRRAIALMKDKAALRESLAPLYPDYRFRVVDADDLASINVDELCLPVVLKPAVGFFSVGVHIVATPEDWRRAVAAIATLRENWKSDFAAGVVDNGRFIIEEFIGGDEYAVDAYYDENGEAVVVNILRHEFSSEADVSDRLYYTSPEIIRERLGEFTDYLNRVGERLAIRDFPLHLELRLSDKGIIPIEFNPLRFAGWCTTDLALFAYGIHTYGMYLQNRRPDWDAALKRKDGNIYSLVILDKMTADGARGFDWKKAKANFTEVLSARVLGPEAPVWGFMFTRTPATAREEIDTFIQSDLREYMLT